MSDKLSSSFLFEEVFERLKFWFGATVHTTNLPAAVGGFLDRRLCKSRNGTKSALLQGLGNEIGDVDSGIRVFVLFRKGNQAFVGKGNACLLYTSPSPRDRG